MDSLSVERRSENMRRIKSRNTKPELLVRRLAHSMGYRFRLHVKKLPGTPDIVFHKRKSVIFVHGCFWHMHQNCREGRVPSSNPDYWTEKLSRNVVRDRAHRAELENAGWRVLEIWECEVSDIESLRANLRYFLDV